MTTAGFILRLSQRTIPKWAIGVAVATPVVALAQGCLMLDEFRSRHGHAPRPVVPSRGVVVVRPDDGTHQSSSHQLPALRLLVIGDSLAAGVGVSDSGTPVLPEAIAKALSRALNGRAVFWTCVGTPGASSSQILHALHGLEKQKRTEEGENQQDEEDTNALETKFAEWRNTKHDDDGTDDNQETEQQLANKDVDDEEKDTKNPLIKLVAKIQTKVKDTITKHNIIDQVTQKIVNRRRTTPDAETAIVSQYVAQYDIAIVLTGLNDLKKAYLPFMNKESPEERKGHADGQEEPPKDTDITTVARGCHSGMDDFSRIVNAVQSKMRPGRPLVVFPAIPTSSVPIFQQAPLNWFLVPLLQKIDQHKKKLAEKFPGLVLYVEAPSNRELSEVEAQRGPLWASRQTEKVLLKLTDVGHNVREKVEQLMKQHYQAWTKDAEEGDDKKKSDDDNDDDDVLFCNDTASQAEWSYSKLHSNNYNKTAGRPGSTMIAPDNVHPNDLGYDIWGRHIAAAIVHSLNRNE